MINAHKIKQDIVEIGRRLYDKGVAAANDGNITVRISELGTQQLLRLVVRRASWARGFSYEPVVGFAIWPE